MMNESAYKPERVDVYRLRLDLPESDIATRKQWLSAEEKARAEKYLSAIKAREFIITRSSLKKILATTLAEDPANIIIAHASAGKPYLVCADRHTCIRFSVSHSYNMALIAITQDHAVGVDVEKIRSNIDYETLSRRFFSSAEFELLQQCNATTRLRAFFAVWTRKEAIVKATGKGIALGLKQFDVSVDPDQPGRVLATRWEQADMPDWTLLNLETTSNYIASLAVSSSNVHVRYMDPQ